jgi:hypothetical protein
VLHQHAALNAAPSTNTVLAAALFSVEGQPLALGGISRLTVDAPQSRDEIDPIEAAIRGIDDQLRIRWNPRSYITVPGGFDVYGLPISRITRDGGK